MKPKAPSPFLLNWDRIWFLFNAWYENKSESSHCKSCGNKKHEEPEWDDQADKIERLVMRELKGKI